MTLEARLLANTELDEWLTSHPGEPRVGPSCFSISIVTNNVAALDAWMAESCGDRFTKTKYVRILMTDRSGKEQENDLHLVVYQFLEKRDLIVVKLTWGGQ